MLRRAAALAAILLAMAPRNGSALDRGHFKGMDGEDFAPILAAFEGVDFHYLVEPNEKWVMSRMTKLDPKVNGLTDFGLFVYFNPQDAQWSLERFEKETSRKALVRSDKVTKVIRRQFERRNAAPSSGIHEPDYIIYLTRERKIDTIEYLVRRGDVTPMTIKGAGGKDTVVAFLSRAKAMEVQAGLKQKGVEADRIGFDEKQFMRFIVDQARQGRAVQIQGY